MSAVIPYPTGPIELIAEFGIGQYPGSTWDDPGTYWDFAAWGQADTTLGDWVDLTCDISEITLTSGASAPDGIITQIDAATGGIVLHGDQFNPWSGPWSGILGPDVDVRIRWRRPGDSDWRPVFRGVTDGWPFERSTHTANVPILDPTGYLANLKLNELPTPVGRGESITARIGRVLDAALWPANRRRIPANRILPCIATQFGAPAWDLIRTAADTDLGIVYCDRAGDVCYIPVGQVGQWAPVLLDPYLTDQHGIDSNELCVSDYVREDPEVVRNDVVISRDSDPGIDGDTPVPAEARSDASAARYGLKTYSRTDLIQQADSWSATVAAMILRNDSFPAPHPQAAEIDIRADARVADLLLSAEISQIIRAHDEGRDFLCGIVGYGFTLNREELTGLLVLQDVSNWQAALWDGDYWDSGDWGVQ